MRRLNNHIVGVILPCMVAVMASCGEDERKAMAELKAWEP